MWRYQIVLILQADCSKPSVQRPRRLSRPSQFWLGARLDCPCRGVWNGAVSRSGEVEAVPIELNWGGGGMNTKVSMEISLLYMIVHHHHHRRHTATGENWLIIYDRQSFDFLVRWMYITGSENGTAFIRNETGSRDESSPWNGTGSRNDLEHKHRPSAQTSIKNRGGAAELLTKLSSCWIYRRADAASSWPPLQMLYPRSFQRV